MKIQLTFKSPDAIYEALLRAGISRRYPDGDDSETYDEIYEELSKWVHYGEYLNVEYDTETKQMIIIKK